MIYKAKPNTWFDAGSKVKITFGPNNKNEVLAQGIRTSQSRLELVPKGKKYISEVTYKLEDLEMCTEEWNCPHCDYLYNYNKEPKEEYTIRPIIINNITIRHINCPNCKKCMACYDS